MRWVTDLTIHHVHREWNIDLVHEEFRPVDVEEIAKIKLPRRDSGDVLACQFEKMGIFSVNSAYKLAIKLIDEGSQASSSATDRSRPLFKHIWTSGVPPKVKIFRLATCPECTGYQLFTRKTGISTWMILGAEKKLEAHEPAWLL